MGVKIALGSPPVVDISLRDIIRLSCFESTSTFIYILCRSKICVFKAYLDAFIFS